MRADVAAHAAKPEVLASTTSVFVEGGRPLAMQELIELNVSHWPEHAMHGLERTVESWRQLIVRPDCWTDVAFTQLAADLRRAHIHLIAVDDLSKVWDMGTISPCNGVQGTALVEVGVWYNRHFVAVVDALPAAGAEPPELHASQPSSGAAAEPGFTFPITTLDEVRRLLRSRNPPTDLCGFEFSGAQRSALEAKGRVALSADERDCVIGGMHFKGDVRPLLTITVWQRAYLFPPCFQQLRGDLDCIELKIEDGRAFWGSAMVLLCIFLTTALMLLVEQPDTIFNDAFDADAWPDVQVHEFRTAQYGDSPDKFVRLTTRNVALPPPPFPGARSPRPPRSQFDFANPDERDRSRSTWQPFEGTCAALASAKPLSAAPPQVTYAAAMELFAVTWLSMGRPLPSGYLDPLARPPSAEQREYQKQRGPGDGRLVDAVDPISQRGAPVYATRKRLVALSEPAQDDGGSDDEVLALVFDNEAGSYGGAAVLRPQQGQAKSPRIDEAPPAFDPPAENQVDVRQAAEGAAVLLFMCVLGQPLVLAHANGFSMIGLEAPPAARSTVMARIRLLCAALVSAFHVAFMIGKYASGLKVFAAPVDFAPEPGRVCRSPSQRLRWLAQGATFVWCTLAALQGTAVADAATRAFVTVDMFRQPTTQLADSTPASSLFTEFKFGVTSARSAVPRPAAEAGPPAWAAISHSLLGDEMLTRSILATVEAGDHLLEGWAEQIKPLDVSNVPKDLLENAPSFADTRLDGVPLQRI